MKDHRKTGKNYTKSVSFSWDRGKKQKEPYKKVLFVIFPAGLFSAGSDDDAGDAILLCKLAPEEEKLEEAVEKVVVDLEQALWQAGPNMVGWFRREE